MLYEYSTYGLLLIVIILVYLLFRNSRGAQPALREPVRGVDITGDDQSPLKRWDCSISDRQIVLSDVPTGLTPHLYPFDEDELRKQPLEGFEQLVSIAADIRLLDQKSKEVQELESPVRMWMSYNAKDILALQKSGYTVNDLVPVKIVPGQTGWRRFSEDAVDYENIKCGEMGGVYITISSWGDPPTGWGSPKTV
jgi:hypothetical protein